MSKEWIESYERASKKQIQTIVVDLRDHYKILTSQADKVVVVGFRAKSSGILVPNDYVANYVRTDPKKMIGFMSVDPNYDDVKNEIECCYHDLGLRGIKISPVYQNFHPTDRKAYPMYEKAVELDIPLLIHMSPTFPRTAPLKYGNPTLFDDIAIQFPELRMIFAHQGYPYGYETAAIARKHPNVFADCSFINGRPWKYFNILLEWYEYCQSLEKIIFGSDYPWATTSQTMEVLRGINNYARNTNIPTIPEQEIEKEYFHG